MRQRRTHSRAFSDRRSAGRVLAKHLADYAGKPDVIVLALPRGGVPVAYEVARALRAPLDVFVVRKLGFPGHEDVAVPVASRQAVESLRDEADEVVAASIPELFYAVGAHYDDFTQTTDVEVRELLQHAAAA